MMLDDATRILQAAIAKAKKMNIKISVAVCDGGGRLVALNRMDGASWASVSGCQGKAITSSAFARPSGEVMGLADNYSGIRAILAAEGSHMIPLRGAVPIVRGGVVEGACGVGGGTNEQDEECARAGLAVL